MPATLGHYKVESQLGAGAMGVVYRATDTRLARDVAIKVLHEATLQSADARARFEREARLLASLNHANIAAIHGLEHAAGVSFLVLEYVPGETLAERLARGALPVRDTLAIARQVAEALEVAHGRGVIHRDLKPANIKLTPDGQVKVLDFGLAKALEPASAGVEPTATVTAPVELTDAGRVMGTVAYMSPEQASARPVDQRTDLWAFGCVVYEMLTGTRAFEGDTTTEVLVRVLDREPDWSALPPATPEIVRSLLRQCLAKDARCRLHHAADARLQLDDALARPPAGDATTGLPRRARSRVLLAGAAGGLLVAATLVGVWMWPRTQPSAPARVVRFAIDLPPDAPQRAGWGSALTFDREGRTLLYAVRGRVYARRLDEAEAAPLKGVEGLFEPVYSPDNRWLLVDEPAKGLLAKVPLAGGAPVPITTVDMYFRGDWSADGYVYGSDAAGAGAIFRAPDRGGGREWVTQVDLANGERRHRYDRLLPGDSALLLTVVTDNIASYNDARIDVVDLATRKRTPLVQGGTYPRYSPSGHLVYARGGSLYAVPLDLRTLKVAGSPAKVLDGVLMTANIGTAYFDVSPTGDLAYAAGPGGEGGRTLHWVDRAGRATPLGLPARSYLNPRLSPDGRQLAIEVEGPNHDFYVYDFGRDVMSKISSDGASHAPIWTPDGRRIAYRTNRFGKMTMAWMPADRSGPEERLMDVVAWQSAVSFSPDGMFLAFDQYDDWTSAIWVLPIQGRREPRPVVKGRSAGAAKFSPDGRWLVYSSMESGRPEIYVQGWPEGPKTQISSDGGTDALWRHDGREIFYRNGDKMMAVSVTPGRTLQPGRPQLLWTGDYTHGLSSSCGWPGTSRTSYDVSADGQRFLMIKTADEALQATKIVVVVNWVEELKLILAEASGEERK